MEFAKIRTVVGYDINSARISDLKRELTPPWKLMKRILKADTLHFTSDPSDLKNAIAI